MIDMERCPCGQKGCHDYHLTGIGKFVQGSGFTYKEAKALIDAYNARKLTPGTIAQKLRDDLYHVKGPVDARLSQRLDLLEQAVLDLLDQLATEE